MNEPSIPSDDSNSSFRFGLIHVFLGVALLAVAFAFIASAMRAATIQQEAIANLRFTGWEVDATMASLSRDSSPKAIPRGQLQNLGKLTSLTKLHLAQVRLEREDIPELAPLTNLRELRLRSCQFDGDAIGWIEQLASLQELHFLDCSPPPEEFVRAAPNLPIEELTIARLDQAAAEAIGKMPRLTRLTIQAGDLPVLPLATLARSSSIHTLELLYCNCTNEGAQALIAWKSLKTVELGPRTDMSVEGWAELIKVRPDLNIVHLSGK